MSIETRVQNLESQHKSLDAAFREMMKVVAGTHEVVSLILTEQMEMRKEQMEMRRVLGGMERELEGMERELEGMRNELGGMQKELRGVKDEHVGFREETREKLELIEQLVRQTYTRH